MSNHPKGLTGAEVEQSRQRYGANVLTPPKRKSLWRLFFEKFNDPVIRILLVAALLSLGIGFIHNEFAEAIGIFCAIFLATGVAFWFEYDAMKKFDVLNSTNDDTPVKVVRDGHVTEIPKRDVVVGDTVILQSGEEVPADGRLTEAVSLKINESTLTGEPQIDKTTDPAHFDPEATYPSDHAMRGTTVIEGHGTMTVTAVGDATEFGHVAEQATVESEEQTPLNLQLQKLSKLIGRVGISLAIVTFVALLVKGMIIGDLLRMGEQEMGCPVEMEFAVDMDVPYGAERTFCFLQIRPIVEQQDARSLDWDSVGTSDALIYAESALGLGAIEGVTDVVYVRSGTFDTSRTQRIASEIGELNNRLRSEKRPYVLVGPGRWGSSDPWLGIPVKWPSISEAKVIVECGLENFRVEPSQGTHFFQNLTSFGVGYLTINPFMGDGRFDEGRLDAMPAVYESESVRHVRFDAPLYIYIDGRKNKGIVRERQASDDSAR